MTINREIWRPPFGSLPRWPCPSCSAGHLTVVKETFQKQEPGRSSQARDIDGWDPEWLQYRFSCLMRCDNQDYAEIVAVAGTGSVHDVSTGYDEQEFEDRFTPKLIIDAPPLFPIPDLCPQGVAGHLLAAFELYWVDAGACGTRIRAAVESLLDEREIPRTFIDKGRRRRIDLHNRILRYKKHQPEAADALLAIKWLGNAGSHDDRYGLSNDDLLDALDIFQHVLDVIYVRNAQRIARLAKRINRRKGPAASKKKRPRKSDPLWPFGDV